MAARDDHCLAAESVQKHWVLVYMQQCIKVVAFTHHILDSSSVAHFIVPSGRQTIVTDCCNCVCTNTTSKVVLAAHKSTCYNLQQSYAMQYASNVHQSHTKQGTDDLPKFLVLNHTTLPYTSPLLASVKAILSDRPTAWCSHSAWEVPATLPDSVQQGAQGQVWHYQKSVLHTASKLLRTCTIAVQDLCCSKQCEHVKKHAGSTPDNNCCFVFFLVHTGLKYTHAFTITLRPPLLQTWRNVCAVYADYMQGHYQHASTFLLWSWLKAIQQQPH